MRHLMPLLAAAASVLSTAPALADLGDQLFKLLADDGTLGDEFGRAVAICGETAIVGARFNDDNGTDSGSAYLFDITTGGQIAELLPDDGMKEDSFGYSVAIGGGIAIVGSRYDGDNGFRSGSAYLFDATTGQQLFKLLPNDGETLDQFGFIVAISGDTAIVGAWRDDDNGSSSGAAYLFDATTGLQTAKLLPDDGAANDQFGYSVAISGTTAVIGARWDDDNGDDSGSAYLFDISDPKNPVQMVKLLPSDGEEFDQFGLSVAISGTTAIVGAHFDDDNGTNSGSAYLFDTATGQQIAKLLASDGATTDAFGNSVAISGPPGSEVAIVGSRFDDDNGNNSGSAYLFGLSDPKNPVQIAKLLPDDGVAGDRFGVSVAVSGPPGNEIAIVGAFFDDDNGTDSGSAYLFAATDAFPAALTACSITFGSTDNNPCDVANLGSDDDVDQILRSQFGFSAFERNLTEIVIQGNGPEATAMLSIKTRDGSDTTNVVAKVKARNYTSNSIVDIAQYDVTFPVSDTPHATIVNSADFVDANGDVELRLRYVAPATFTPLGFTVGLDQVEVMVE